MPQSSIKISLAKKKEKAELYTLYDTISTELRHYKRQLSRKKIICPCDWDEALSENSIHKCNFVRFLNIKKQEWKIKSISWSGWNPADPKNKAKLNNIEKFQDIDYTRYDIVITNPPPDQFGEFIDIMMKFPKLKFLVIGYKQAMWKKNIFTNIQKNKIWLGNTSPTEFIQINGQVKKIRTFWWYTNMKVSCQKKIILTESYDVEKYSKYENYDAINIDNFKSIPKNYFGIMGVPLGFIFNYDPKQFKIIGFSGDKFMFTEKNKLINLKTKNSEVVLKALIKCKKSAATYKHMTKEEFYLTKERIFIHSINSSYLIN